MNGVSPSRKSKKITDIPKEALECLLISFVCDRDEMVDSLLAKGVHISLIVKPSTGKVRL